MRASFGSAPLLTDGAGVSTEGASGGDIYEKMKWGRAFEFIFSKISRGERGTREGQGPFFFTEAEPCA